MESIESICFWHRGRNPRTKGRRTHIVAEFVESICLLTPRTQRGVHQEHRQPKVSTVGQKIAPDPSRTLLGGAAWRTQNIMESIESIRFWHRERNPRTKERRTQHVAEFVESICLLTPRTQKGRPPGASATESVDRRPENRA